MIICENNTVFAKSDFWSKMRHAAPVSPTSNSGASVNLFYGSLQMFIAAILKFKRRSDTTSRSMAAKLHMNLQIVKCMITNVVVSFLYSVICQVVYSRQPFVSTIFRPDTVSIMMGTKPIMTLVLTHLVKLAASMCHEMCCS